MYASKPAPTADFLKSEKNGLAIIPVLDPTMTYSIILHDQALACPLAWHDRQYVSLIILSHLEVLASTLVPMCC